MYTITLDGKEYILRCDLNVVEKIEEKYGTITSLLEKQGNIACTKFLAAEMINEHFYYCNVPDRVTEGFVGARLSAIDLEQTVSAVLSCLMDCVCKKK